MADPVAAAEAPGPGGARGTPSVLERARSLEQQQGAGACAASTPGAPWWEAPLAPRGSPDNN